MTLVVGDALPEFVAKNHAGDEVSSAALLGDPVLFVFVPFAFSGICTGELCEIRDNLAVFNDLGVRVIGVSCDPSFSQAAWAKQEGYEFELVSDFWPHGEISRKFGVFHEGIGASERGSFLVDASGIVRWVVKNELGQGRSLDDYRAAIAEMQANA